LYSADDTLCFMYIPDWHRTRDHLEFLTCFMIAIELVRANQLYSLFSITCVSKPGNLGTHLARDCARDILLSKFLIGFFSLASKPLLTRLIATSSIIVIGNNALPSLQMVFKV
jgi:hypothetical protein